MEILKKSIAMRIVSAIALFVVVGMVALIFAQAHLTSNFFASDFAKNYEEKTLLLSSQMYGGVKWKKRASIEAVYASQILPDSGSNLSNVLVTDTSLQPLDFYKSDIYENIDIANLLKMKKEDLKETSHITIDDASHIVTMMPIVDKKKGEIIGYAAIAWSKAASLSQLASMRNMSAILGCVVAVLILATLIILLRMLAIKPITSIQETMTTLAKGEMSVDVPFLDNLDEIGRMAGALQVFKENAIEKLRLEAEQVEKERLAEQEKKEALRALAKEFEDNIGSLISTLASASTELQSTAESMSGISEETSRFSNTVAASSNDASANVASVVNAMEQMTLSSNEITQQINTTQRQSENVSKSADNANAKIANLEHLMLNIGDVVSAIRDIAEQTNLLALNATIEAARAGEAGKGFAVVADEVKKLATETGQKTDDVEARIQEISAAVGSSVQAVEEIINNVSEINNAVTIVSAAVEEQNVTGREINRSINEASQGVQNVTNVMGDMQRDVNESKNAADAVLTAANELARVSENIDLAVNQFIEKIG